MEPLRLQHLSQQVNPALGLGWLATVTPLIGVIEMPIRVFHPDHGYVLTSDQKEIDDLLARGGSLDAPKQQEQNILEIPIKQELPKAVITPKRTYKR